ncbi:helix-turn-helix domain-containing protein [Mesonia sp.]|uniref:helix-turn-helix domain-containing protein n=1 Tax=Mesonia sp. TaxID=1960830 RepID=UPI003F9C5E70
MLKYLHEVYPEENLTEQKFIIAFGQNLKKLRKQKGFTQEQLAIDLNIEISQISRIERGVINTSIGNVNAIAKVLKIDHKELFEFCY